MSASFSSQMAFKRLKALLRLPFYWRLTAFCCFSTTQLVTSSLLISVFSLSVPFQGSDFRLNTAKLALNSWTKAALWSLSNRPLLLLSMRLTSWPTSSSLARLTSTFHSVVFGSSLASSSSSESFLGGSATGSSTGYTTGSGSYLTSSTTGSGWTTGSGSGTGTGAGSYTGSGSARTS